jgi:flavin-dependent dehydrogenase
MSYKVAIIGAGPGGALLARELAGQGIIVDLYEKGTFEELGHDWSDAVELIALKKAGFDMPHLDETTWKGVLVKKGPGKPGLFEKHAVPVLQIRSPGQKSTKQAAFRMITTDRRQLGQTLVKQALAAGAAIHYRHEGLKLLFSEKGSIGLDNITVYGAVIKNLETGDIFEIKADLVVESSGFQSVLRRSLPASSSLANPFAAEDFALVHREVRGYAPGAQGADVVPDHYRYGFHSGYQWTHIHNEETIDVGAGVKNDPVNPDPQDIIEEFISRHPAIKTEKHRGGRSLCIVGRPLDSFITGGFMVIGDAASTSVPTTGCGAGSAMLAALSAARVISEAAADNRNDLEKLWAINTNFYLKSDRGPSFAALSVLRNALQSFNHEELDFFYAKDLLDSTTLQNAVNGIFRPLSFGQAVKALGALTRLPLLLRLNKAVVKATRLYRHYQDYPETWDKRIYQKWLKRAEELRN